ncbi:TPA: hypothetical protein DEP94_01190 [Candidatus Nomurabacteria bacterium]|nr:hypothetical protein [Candidatus Nomurabacteria bacterium]
MATKETVEIAPKATRDKTPKQIKIEQRAFMRQVALEATYQNTICALRTAGLLCRHGEYMPINEYHNQCYTTFLMKLHVALKLLVGKPKTLDISVINFLPNRSMTQVFEEIGVRRMSEFLSTPLADMISAVSRARMKFPMYIQYMHPDFEPPAAKSSKSHKARK